MKTLMKFSAITLMLIAFLGASTLNAQEWTKDQKEVWKTVEKSWENWKAGDLDAAFKLVHDKYMGWNHEDPMPTNKAKWFKSAKMIMENGKLVYYDIEPARIMVHGDVAVVHYYFEYTASSTKNDETKEFSVKGKNAEFFVKEGGKWLLIGDMTFWKSKK